MRVISFFKIIIPSFILNVDFGFVSLFTCYFCLNLLFLQTFKTFEKYVNIKEIINLMSIGTSFYLTTVILLIKQST